MVKIILRCFKLASNLKVNFLKSGVEVEVVKLITYAYILNCGIMFVSTWVCVLGVTLGS